MLVERLFRIGVWRFDRRNGSQIGRRDMVLTEVLAKLKHVYDVG